MMTSLNLSAVAKGPRGPPARLTTLPYDSLRLRFRPSPPQDKPDSLLYGWVPFIRSASSPISPLSNSQGVSRIGERAGSSPHPGDGQKAAGGDVGAWDQGRIESQKLKDLDLHGIVNPRPGSRNSSNRRTLSVDKGGVFFDREELSPLASAVTLSKQPPLRVNGFKNNLLKADHYLSQRSHGSAGPEEDLVAMGKLWTPSHQLQSRCCRTATIITSTTTTISSSTSTKAISARFITCGNSGSAGGGFSTLSGTLPASRPIPVTAPTWHTLHHSSSLPAPAMGNVIKSSKESDPKYSDPMVGAPSAFQQRLMEMAALEQETVRWERGKKVKKKPCKQDS